MKLWCRPVFFRLLRCTALFGVLWTALLTPVTLLAQGSRPTIIAQPHIDVEIPSLVRAKDPGMTASAEAATVGRSAQAAVARARAVDVDFGVLQDVFDTLTIAAEPTTIRIPFFDDSVLLAEITSVVRTSSGGLAFTGTVPDAMHSTVVLVNNNGVVSMNVSTLSKRYSIHGSAQTGYTAKELQQLDLPDHGSPPIVVNAPPLPKPTRQTAADTLVAADTGTQMDVMVVYTPAARVNNGGTAQMHANIDAQVALTNMIYANSNVVQRLRLVYKGEVAYTETTDGVDLGRLQNRSDGFMDSVPILRDIHKADFVSLWGNYPTTCGLGYLMGTESSGFEDSAYNTVNSPGCTGAGSGTFAHELGHNMGLQHDKFVAPDNTTVTPEGSTVSASITYAHGYVDTVNRFRTVMAYDDECLATAPFTSCNRTLTFGNPSVLFNGVPTGKLPNSHERQALNDTRETTANFRIGLPDSAFVGPGILSFAQPTYSVAEGGGSVQLTVERHVGFTGAISVNYATASGTATAGADFTTTSGTLTWASGDSTSRVITVPILQDTLLEGNETFTVVLNTPGGGVSIGALNGTTTSATVTILDDEPDNFPVGGVIPTGFVTPATSTAAWTVDVTGGYLSPSSLQSAAVLSVDGINFANSDLEYTATFPAGNVTFYYRVSSYSTSTARLEFMIDGIVPASFTPIGGETAWLFASVPITAGNHTLRWRFKNRLQFVCTLYIPPPPGGDACAGRAWIDAVTFVPLAPVSSTTALGSSQNPSNVSAPVTFTAIVAGNSATPTGTPTGTVDFRDGDSVIAACSAVTLVNGAANCTTSSLAKGTHTITALYSGSATYATSTSSAISQTVNATGMDSIFLMLLLN